MSAIADAFTTIAQSLYRKSAMVCSKWAIQYRMMSSGPWSFDRYPWTKEIHDNESSKLAVMKGAQLGITEAALNRVFYKIDMRKSHCLYLLPAEKPDAHDFSAARFDAAIEASEHIREMFSATKNIGHKRAGTVNLYIRGTRSKNALKSIPVNDITYDEVDEMSQENLPLAHERLSGSTQPKQERYISTPTIHKYGIHNFYLEGDQRLYFFNCPSCNKFIDLSYPDSLIVTGETLNDPELKNSHLICKECKALISHEAKTELFKTGKWVPQETGNPYASYYINQLYSTTISPYELAIGVIKAQNNAADEVEFHNSKIGMPFIKEGAKLEMQDIDKCVRDYTQIQSVNIKDRRLRTLGVDVGKFIHYEIDEWIANGEWQNDINQMALSKVIAANKVTSFDRLPEIMRQYCIDTCVIDANPERRMAKKFANLFPGRVHLCYYSRNVKEKDINKKELDNGVGLISVDRTSWLDMAIGRFFNETILLPKDISIEYKNHLCAVVRQLRNDENGNPVSFYLSQGEDHFAHCRNYCEMGLPLAASLATNKNIKSFL